MSHSYAQNIVHIAFGTEDRAAAIPVEFQADLWAYLAGICHKHEIFVHILAGMTDHVHLLIQIPASISLARSINTIKSNSSKWAHEKGRKLAWQTGYAAFSVSASVVPAVVPYIENQAAHHRKMSFADGFVALLKKQAWHTIRTLCWGR